MLRIRCSTSVHDILALWALVVLSHVVGDAPPSCSFDRGQADPTPPVSLGLIGIGLVGRELAFQLAAQRVALKLDGSAFRVVAAARSRGMSLPADGEDLTTEIALGGSAKFDEATDLKRFGEHVWMQPGLRLIVDCTAGDEAAEFYAQWLASGVSVVTPNKRFGSGPLERYEQAREAAKVSGAKLLYEATVGAGLPVFSVLRDLLRSGDVVHRIEGIFSGTLSFLFNQLEVGVPLSVAVREAARLGFTEPDPREDLRGTDVQRKVTILARECGLRLELTDVPVESLVPDGLGEWQPSSSEIESSLAASFVQRLAPSDAAMASRVGDAASRGEVLRYVGVVDVLHGKASVKVRSLPSSHPFAATQHADNVVTFTTDRYTLRPLVVQGPGAGAAVTAGGIFSDLLRAGL